VTEHPDIVIVMTDEERAEPPYESADVRAWRHRTLTGRRWFDEHGVTFGRHYTGSLACVPSRPTIFTGQYPDLHGVTQTDGIGKRFDDSRLRWLRAGEVPTLGNWFRAAGYDTHYDGKWHISHADLQDPATGESLATNDGRLLRLGRARTTRGVAVQQRFPQGPVDRQPGGGMARGPVCATPRR
jgi:arylsulfatase A-like enzyme